jgi:site-specific recombinase XerD
VPGIYSESSSVGVGNQLVSLVCARRFVLVHMLRHSTGFVLANKGMDTRWLQRYFGHASITNTARCTAF